MRGLWRVGIASLLRLFFGLVMLSDCVSSRLGTSMADSNRSVRALRLIDQGLFLETQA